MFFSAQEAFWLEGWTDNTMGPQRPITMANDASYGAIAWTNLTQAGDTDGNAASVVLSGGQVSNLLVTTEYDFNLPSTAVIKGIRVEVVRWANVIDLSDSGVFIVKNGVVGVDNKFNPDADSWNTTPTTIYYGGYGDLWGLTWTAADINAADFGVAFSAQSSLGATASVDSIKILVWYYV